MTIFMYVMLGASLMGTYYSLDSLRGEHPRKQKGVTLGSDVASLILSLAMLGWTGYLIFN
jgi:hypothetical protein